MKNAKVLFGSIIVAFLLALYVYCVWRAINLAISGPKPVEELPDGISRTMATVGGLVSALVIAQLAAADPKHPLERTALFSGGVLEKVEWVVPYIKGFYVVIWIVLGFAAFVVGELWFPNKVPPLTTFAQAWLGLAVAAGYAYFGIDRST